MPLRAEPTRKGAAARPSGVIEYICDPECPLHSVEALTGNKPHRGEHPSSGFFSRRRLTP